MPRKLRAELMSRIRLAPSNTTRSINVSSSPNSSATVPGATIVPAASSRATRERVVVDHDSDQRGRALPVGGSRHRPHRHLDEGVVPPLCRRPRQVRHRGVVPVDRFGDGPVGGEQLAFDPVERPVDRRRGDGGEVSVGMADAVETDADAEPAKIVVAAVATLGTVGISRVSPVGAQPFPVVEPQPPPFGHEVGFARWKVRRGAGVTGQPGEDPHVGGRDVPGPERGPRFWHRPQPAGVAHLAGDLRAGEAGVDRDPIGR